MSKGGIFMSGLVVATAMGFGCSMYMHGLRKEETKKILEKLNASVALAAPVLNQYANDLGFNGTGSFGNSQTAFTNSNVSRVAQELGSLGFAGKSSSRAIRTVIISVGAIIWRFK